MRNGFIIDYKTVAAHLAHSDEQDQAEFFTTFFDELRACCKTKYNTEKQLWCIYDKLSEETKELLGMFGSDFTVEPVEKEQL